MQRISSSDLPRQKKLAFIHEFVSQRVAGRRFKPLDDDFRIDLAALTLHGQTVVGAARYTPIVGMRSHDLLSDGREGYLLTIHDATHEFSAAGKPTIKPEPGDLTLVSDAIDSEFRLPATEVKVVAVAWPGLANRIPRIDMSPFYHIPRDAPGMALFTAYSDLLRQYPPENEALAQAANNHLNELIALVLGGFVKGGTDRNEHSIRAARLELVKKEIEARLRDPDLNIGAIARSHGVTPRYIQRLFEAEGVTYSEYLLERRLELALDLLRQAEPRDSRMSAIAYEAGFCDLSHFNRCFRRRYGTTPSEIRADAMRRRGL
ncbi:helix-turn-helix transcriptional regulator [Mesorhizobium sp. L-8-3]|uniref:helix-turn-helix transcriptional regulator n=1 Tax=Mesorhizobium sp. L-8-3 TaxID=2744522 RepID=UPI0019293B1A|nr:helix-turn-helix transcriptional regulator [Mesorhizobium sp. L-8-3]BCH21040.1 AraC family transcriptional regulator [Mesorhizobium sp. L-8-3]